jgi:hypothetical protein
MLSQSYKGYASYALFISMEIAKSMQQIEQQKRLLLCRTSHVPVRLVPPVVSQNTTVTQERMTLRAKKTLVSSFLTLL